MGVVSNMWIRKFPQIGCPPSYRQHDVILLIMGTPKPYPCFREILIPVKHLMIPDSISCFILFFHFDCSIVTLTWGNSHIAAERGPNSLSLAWCRWSVSALPVYFRRVSPPSDRHISVYEYIVLGLVGFRIPKLLVVTWFFLTRNTTLEPVIVMWAVV